MTRSRTESRPRPLAEAAQEHAPVPAAAGALLSALLLVGLITRGTFDVLAYVLAGTAILVGAASTALAIHRTVRAGEQQVTPNSDPRDHNGVELVPRTEQLLAEVLEQITALIITGPPAPTPPASRPARPVAEPAAGPRPPRNPRALLGLPPDVDDDPPGPPPRTARRLRDPAMAQLDPAARRRPHRYRDSEGGPDGTG